MASQNTSYDRETMRRIDHVLHDLKPWYVPSLDLYIVAVACYSLGVCDGKRAERVRNKQKMRNLYHFIETL